MDCYLDWEAFLFESNFLGLPDRRLCSSSADTPSDVLLPRLPRLHGMLCGMLDSTFDRLGRLGTMDRIFFQLLDGAGELVIVVRLLDLSCRFSLSRAALFP